MSGFAKGVIVTVVGALICREFYAKGYNNAMKHVNKMADFREAVIKEVKES